MSASRITYGQKEFGGKPKTIHEQQWWFDDANEVKSVANDHADLLDQFTFSDPLDGKVGLGVTPTAKLHAKASVGGDDLLKLETFGGGTALQVYDNGTVGINRSFSPQYNLDITGSFRASGTVNLTGGLVQFTGTEWAAISHVGSLFSIRPNSIPSSSISLDVATGQIGLGSTINTEISSVVEVTSTTKGSIPFPRMTETQRLAITSPANGLHVYQTDGTEGVYVNKSTGWVLAY